MQKKTVDLTITQLMEDLNNGMTWLEKDNEGYGSIQNKYGAKDIEILTIQKHPKLKGLEPSITVFNIIDDTKDESSTNSTTTGKEPARTAPEAPKPVVPVVPPTPEMEINSSSANGTTSTDSAFDHL